MIIRPHKILLIKKNFIEFSFNEDEDDDIEIIPDFEKFKTLNSAEQYFLADNYNWEDGPIVLDWIIDSPKCDKGTASLIFWRAELTFISIIHQKQSKIMKNLFGIYCRRL